MERWGVMEEVEAEEVIAEDVVAAAVVRPSSTVVLAMLREIFSRSLRKCGRTETGALHHSSLCLHRSGCFDSRLDLLPHCGLSQTRFFPRPG